MESKLKIVYDGKNYEIDTTGGDQTLKEVFESWHAQNKDTIKDELETLDFHVGPEIYGYDDYAGIKKLNELDQEAFRGLIEVKVGVDQDNENRAVDDDTPFHVDLQMPKGRQQMKFLARHTILEIKEEIQSKLQIGGADSAEKLIMQHQNKKCLNDDELRKYRKF